MKCSVNWYILSQKEIEPEVHISSGKKYMKLVKISKSLYAKIRILVDLFLFIPYPRVSFGYHHIVDTCIQISYSPIY